MDGAAGAPGALPTAEAEPSSPRVGGESRKAGGTEGRSGQRDGRPGNRETRWPKEAGQRPRLWWGVSSPPPNPEQERRSTPRPWAAPRRPV